MYKEDIIHPNPNQHRPAFPRERLAAIASGAALVLSGCNTTGNELPRPSEEHAVHTVAPGENLGIITESQLGDCGKRYDARDIENGNQWLMIYNDKNTSEIDEGEELKIPDNFCKMASGSTE